MIFSAFVVLIIHIYVNIDRIIYSSNRWKYEYRDIYTDVDVDIDDIDGYIDDRWADTMQI